MRNPLRDEASAFRLVLVVLAGAALLAVASWISTWLGLAVFLAELAAGIWWLRGGRPAAPEREHVAHPAESEPRYRILVVANETVGGEELHDLLRAKSAGMREDLLVVCPALNSKLRTWTSDEDGARAAALERLEESLSALAASGVQARGTVGDGDPVQAVEDALRSFPADEIVISTHPPGRSNWLEAGVVERVEARFDLPVAHVVVDGAYGAPATVET
jgi:hypothetical protein